MNKHTATLPNGTVITRNSKTHVYAYVVATSRSNGEGWGYWGWASRLDLAEKTAAQARRVCDRVEIVPVEVTTK